MFREIVQFLEGKSMPIALFSLSVLLIFLQTVFWDRHSAKQQARRSMFFGARVEPEFIASASADSILRRFRLRIWLLAFVIAAAYLLLVLLWPRLLEPGSWPVGTLFVFLVSGIGNPIILGVANRETKREANILPGPSARIAPLFVKQDESSAWLTIIDWLAILLPICIPLVTISVVILYWNKFPGNRSPLVELRDGIFSWVIGIFSGATYFALRFRARSSDWAPSPRSSRQYRALLGVMQSGLFSFLSFGGCWLSLMPLLKGGSFGDINTYFRYSFPADICFLLAFLAMRRYLARSLARESSDPMPNHCWKWGYIYYNPDDSALIVPSRSGIGFSYNYARHSVWIFMAILIAAGVFTFI